MSHKYTPPDMCWTLCANWSGPLGVGFGAQIEQVHDIWLYKRAPKGSPRAAQGCPKGAQGHPKGAQWSLKGAQGHPKGTQREPKGRPREPKGRPREPKGSPSGPKGHFPNSTYTNHISIYIKGHCSCQHLFLVVTHKIMFSYKIISFAKDFCKKHFIEKRIL